MLRHFLNIAFSVALCAASASLWFVAGNFDVFGAPGPVGPAFWPRLIIAGVFLLSLGLAVKAVAAGLPAAETPHGDGPRINVGRMVLTAALIVGYFYALQYAGFLISTIVFLGIGINLLPYGNRTAKLIFPFAFTIVIILFFAYALSLPLPRGTNYFYNINSYFY